MIDRAWLHRFALACRFVTLTQFHKTNNCILSTRLGVDVLQHYGVPARPQPVTVTAMNEEAYRLMAAGVPVPQWPDSAWSVGIEGTGKSDPATGSWDGHLVIVLRNPERTRTLIDLTADQLDRPHRGIDVGGPVFMDLKGLWTPQDPLYTVTDDTPGSRTIVTYRPLMTAGDWQAAPDWALYQDHHDELVAAVVKELGPEPPRH